MKLLITIADGETGEILREAEWSPAQFTADGPKAPADHAQDVVDMMATLLAGPIVERRT